MFFKKKKELYDNEIDMNAIPQHIAFIMDGNGRWAKKRKMPRTYGHHEGIKTIRKIALEANKIGVKAMTVYAFSTENFSRPEKEIQYIFKLPKEFFTIYIQELIDNNVQISVIGHLERVPKDTRKVIESAIDKTKQNTGLQLCFAFVYGGRDDILEATKNIITDVKNGILDEDTLDESKFSQYLMTKDLPEVDLMIRTSGEHRLSNYLLWQLAYAEFVFTEVLWPDFDEQELYKCISLYQNRDRRFGGLK